MCPSVSLRRDCCQVPVLCVLLKCKQIMTPNKRQLTPNLNSKERPATAVRKTEVQKGYNKIILTCIINIIIIFIMKPSVSFGLCGLTPRDTWIIMASDALLNWSVTFKRWTSFQEHCTTVPVIFITQIGVCHFKELPVVL